MGKFKKTPFEKFKTKLNTILQSNPELKQIGRTVKLSSDSIFSYNNKNIRYSKKRYWKNSIDFLKEDNYKVIIPLNHENLSLISSGSPNPPKFLGYLSRLFEDANGEEINLIILGSEINQLKNGTLNIKYQIYNELNKIYNEENRDKYVRFKQRALPFFKNEFGLKISNVNTDRDYGLLLKEVIQSGKINQEDLKDLMQHLEIGNTSQIVIQNQINKQVRWLIETIEKVLDEKITSKEQAQKIGNKYFHYTKTSIGGPEDLMEKILTDYGQNTLFGVPALLNINKYVITTTGLSRSQFDLLLVNHLGDIELVELKQPNTRILEIDESRMKFYPSKELAMAITQCERYISTINRFNDLEFLINKKTIKEFLNEELGGVLTVEAVRPQALILIGWAESLFIDYEELDAKTQKKISKSEYIKNGNMAYIEIKNAFKNLKILTYSELCEIARTRLELDKEQ